jgi:hypothetical protein
VNIVVCEPPQATTAATVLGDLEALCLLNPRRVLLLDEAGRFGSDPEWPTLLDVARAVSPRHVSLQGDLVVVEP